MPDKPHFNIDDNITNLKETSRYVRDSVHAEVFDLDKLISEIEDNGDIDMANRLQKIRNRLAEVVDFVDT